MADKPLTNEDSPQEQDELQTSENAGDASAKSIAAAVASACEDDVPAESTGEALQTEKERVLRLQAEMENLRSRTAREINEERRYAALPLMRDLLPALDNIDRAIESAEQSGEAAGLLEGFKLVRQQIITILNQHNCQEIEALGEPFDPQIHEAILQQPSDEQPANYVLMVTEIGYLLHDRVVRPAKVIISSGPAETTDASDGQ